MKKVFLPRTGEEQELFVAVNGKAWRIRRGVEVSVPDPVAEVIANAQAADTATEAFLRESRDRTVDL